MLVLEIFAILAIGDLNPPPQEAVACSTFNAVTGSSYEGRCTIVRGRSDADPYVEVIEAGRERYEIAYLERQGQWTRVTINGRLGMRYEINRTQFAFTTDDLEINLIEGD